MEGGIEYELLMWYELSTVGTCLASKNMKSHNVQSLVSRLQVVVVRLLTYLTEALLFHLDSRSTSSILWELRTCASLLHVFQLDFFSAQYFMVFVAVILIYTSSA